MISPFAHALADKIKSEFNLVPVGQRQPHQLAKLIDDAIAEVQQITPTIADRRQLAMGCASARSSID